MSEPMRAFGYIGPSCGKSVYGERTHFALCASAIGLVCDCGQSELTAEPVGDHYRVTAPCGSWRSRYRKRRIPRTAFSWTTLSCMRCSPS